MLPGPWLAHEADDELRRHFHEADFDDSGWSAIDVPSHWRTNPGFEDSDGPLLYRTRFEAQSPASGDRAWLVFDGVTYQSDIWLDESYVGESEGYFFRHSVEVTEALNRRDNHLLALEVSCAPQSDPEVKRNLTGALQPGGPGWNPGGVWRPVSLEYTGAVRARSLRVLCTEATATRAELAISSQLECEVAQTVVVRTTVTGPITNAEDEPSSPAIEPLVAEHTLAAGTNLIEWTVDIDEPQRWWPRALGRQPLYDVTIEVLVDGEVSHRRTRRTGLRTVSLNNFIFTINGERLFLKGAVHGPAYRDLAAASAADLEADVALATDAGLDFLRLHAHVTRREFYEAADRAGLLLWQDLPLTGGYARSVRKQAVHQAGRAVDTLAHHPSVFAWCAHDEPDRLVHSPRRKAAPMIDADTPADFWRAARDTFTKVASTQLPSWNRSILDRSLTQTLRQADRSRPVVQHSGVPPHPPQLDGTDRHLWFGWYNTGQDASELAGRAMRNPRAVRFVSSFGTQSVPDTNDFMAPEQWPTLDWDKLSDEFGYEREVMSHWVPPEGYPTFAAWRLATQEYQADVIRRQIETLRRLKYRPAGGFAVFRLTDPAPGVSWSLVDHHRVPKLAYQALAEVCRPVIVVADRLPLRLRSGASMALDVHVVNDGRDALVDCQVSAVLRWADGQHCRAWAGEVGADAVVRVATLAFMAPEIPGELSVEIELSTSEGVVSIFRDRCTVFRP